MSNIDLKSFIGGYEWKFSDVIYLKLTGKRVVSNYFPVIPIHLKDISEFFSKKRVYGIFWSTPTFKDTDSNYFFHIYDKKKIDFIISTSSGNTVESMARAIYQYNQLMAKNINAILIVPEISSYKVARSAIDGNPYVKFVVLKNSTLESIRGFASKLKEKMLENYVVAISDVYLKTAAYSQIGLALNRMNMFENDICYVQTVSGGIGPAGLIEYATQLRLNPEILIVQPSVGNSTPIADALNEYSKGNNPLSIFEKRLYKTPTIETTLGSTCPVFAIENFIKWRKAGGRIYPAQITKEELFHYKEKILKILVKIGVYPTIEIGTKLFELEKSGFIAIIGALKSKSIIESKTIIINFTGRYLDPISSIPITASPYLSYNPHKGVENFMKILKMN
ncbi:MAG: hypothetical protein ACFFDK_12745 [Promethearchaeota archaeon]